MSLNLIALRRCGRLKTENAKLRTALLKYGDHTYRCASRKANRPCDCNWIRVARNALANEQD
jgi:hypothetical protein